MQPVPYFYDVNELHAVLADVDVLIDETFEVVTYTDFLTMYRLTPTSPFKFIQNQRVYRDDGLQNPAGAQGTHNVRRETGEARRGEAKRGMLVGQTERLMATWLLTRH